MIWSNQSDQLSGKREESEGNMFIDAKFQNFLIIMACIYA